MANFEDDALPPLSELVSGFTMDVLGEELVGLGDEAILESIEIVLPVELAVETDSRGNVLLAASPPAIRTETSFPAVLHWFRFVLSRS